MRLDTVGARNHTQSCTTELCSLEEIRCPFAGHGHGGFHS